MLLPVLLFAQKNGNNKSSAKGGEMVLIPAGEFWMGTSKEGMNTACAENKKSGVSCEKDWFSDEMPTHKVYLDSYSIDKYEVTNAQYKACVSAGKCKKPYNTTGYNDANKATHPVVYADWVMADNYCKWAGKRLPTEAEWEKASRGKQGNIWPWGNEFDCKKSCNSVSPCKQKTTCAVGSFASDVSSYGIYDMGGNVWEWVSDWYDVDYYTNSPGNNPKGANRGQYRALRGGAWKDTMPYRYRSADRYGYKPPDRNDFGGFRCASSED